MVTPGIYVAREGQDEEYPVLLVKEQLEDGRYFVRNGSNKKGLTFSLIALKIDDFEEKYEPATTEQAVKIKQELEEMVEDLRREESTIFRSIHLLSELAESQRLPLCTASKNKSPCPYNDGVDRWA